MNDLHIGVCFGILATIAAAILGRLLGRTLAAMRRDARRSLPNQIRSDQIPSGSLVLVIAPGESMDCFHRLQRLADSTDPSAVANRAFRLLHMCLDLQARDHHLVVFDSEHDALGEVDLSSL